MAKPMNVLLSLIFSLLSPAKAVYNVINFGAKADGETDSTRSFLSAWTAACGSAHPATILVPPGSYMLQQATFKGPCKNTQITVQMLGTLVAPSNFAALGTSGYWLLFQQISGVSFYGGTLDGRGSGLWSCKASGKSCPAGSTSLTINDGRDVLISGLTSKNSELYHIVIEGCKNVTVQGVKINAPGNSPNTDGIHVQMSTDVKIMTTGIKSGDDCISVGPGTANLFIHHVACGPGHGISIGSLGKDLNEPGVQNVTVEDVVFTGTENGLRIKSWARPSNGFVMGALFKSIVMKNVQNPIIIDQNYCPHDTSCPDQASGIEISNVVYTNVRGTSATPVAVNFDCSPKNPCNGIVLQDINLTYQNKPAKSSCSHADGTTDGVVTPLSCF